MAVREEDLASLQFVLLPVVVGNERSGLTVRCPDLLVFFDDERD